MKATISFTNVECPKCGATIPNSEDAVTVIEDVEEGGVFFLDGFYCKGCNYEWEVNSELNVTAPEKEDEDD